MAGFFTFLTFQGKKLCCFALFVLKTSPKPKVLTLRVSHLTHTSLCLSLTHLKLSNSQTASSSQAFISLCLCLYLCLSQAHSAFASCTAVLSLRSLHSGTLCAFCTVALAHSIAQRHRHPASRRLGFYLGNVLTYKFLLLSSTSI